jgi:hypothetical protein
MPIYRLLRSSIVVGLAVLVLTSCANLGRSTFRSDRGLCGSYPEMAGVWRSRRGSQVGAATATLKLQCDCRYTMTIGLAFSRITEEGEYRVLGDQLVLSRANGETSWPFRLAGETLVLTESETETWEYKRVGPASSCREVKP